MSAITMDTVRDLIERHSDHISGNTREFYNGAYAEIADELNSRVERTCHKIIPDEMEGYVFCSECGAEIGEYGYPNYCPNCGCKVVGE